MVPNLSTTPECPAGHCASGLAIEERGGTVHNHMLHSDRW